MPPYFLKKFILYHVLEHTVLNNYHSTHRSIGTIYQLFVSSTCFGWDRPFSSSTLKHTDKYVQDYYVFIKLC